MKCPLCEGVDTKIIRTIKCGIFDNSNLYEYIRLTECNRCGHIYNQLSDNELKRLQEYYYDEYGQLAITSKNKEVDLPGSQNSINIKRYNDLYTFSKKSIRLDSKILDIGCAAGGFLKYLRNKGCKYLYGTDISDEFIKKAKNECLEIKKGSATSLPFKDCSIDFIVSDQVFEHLEEPGEAFKEIFRVLKTGGMACISVPDASRYKDYPKSFWLSMREHIQHFDSYNLSRSASSYGLRTLSVNYSTLSIVKKYLVMPALTVMFEKVDNLSLPLYNNIIDIKSTFRSSINDYLKKIEDNIKEIDSDNKHYLKPGVKVFAWGIGRDFQFLIENTFIGKCKFTGLIDGHQLKQEKYTIKGQKINSIEILKNSDKNSILFITAPQFEKSIRQELASFGYKGAINTICP